MNIADLIIILFVLAFAFSGYLKGALRQIADIVSLVLAIFVSTVFYSELSTVLADKFSISGNFSKIIAFFLLWIGVQFVFNLFFISSTL
jgi:uncharacterized membrane protein required for colicin V production